MTMDRTEEKSWQGGPLGPDKYMLMNEHEKDIEIEKAVARLQKRIQEILYNLEAQKPGR